MAVCGAACAALEFVRAAIYLLLHDLSTESGAGGSTNGVLAGAVLPLRLAAFMMREEWVHE
jgi:hypothetical protein